MTPAFKFQKLKAMLFFFTNMASRKNWNHYINRLKKCSRAFHQYLIMYDNRKICQCKACISAINLSLKVITHYGEFTSFNVQQFNKLIGKDVIVAHQLLKNDIEQHEYWLVTNDLVKDKQPAGLAQGMQWKNSSKQTESGEINFHYTQLGALKK